MSFVTWLFTKNKYKNTRYIFFKYFYANTLAYGSRQKRLTVKLPEVISPC